MDGEPSTPGPLSPHGGVFVGTEAQHDRPPEYQQRFGRFPVDPTAPRGHRVITHTLRQIEARNALHEAMDKKDAKQRELERELERYSQLWQFVGGLVHGVENMKKVAARQASDIEILLWRLKMVEEELEDLEEERGRQG